MQRRGAKTHQTGNNPRHAPSILVSKRPCHGDHGGALSHFAEAASSVNPPGAPLLGAFQFLTVGEFVELNYTLPNAAEGESRLLLPKSGLHLPTGFQNRQ